MSSVKNGQKEVKYIVEKVKQGDDLAFIELERIAKPMMVSLSNHFSNMHYKFEFDDFYSICLHGLYQSCKTFSNRNPCFLSYARSVIMRHCWRELDYWNMEMRNIFKVREIAIEEECCDSEDLTSEIIEFHIMISRVNYEKGLLEEEAFFSECHHNIETIISENFDSRKARIMRMYLFGDMSPKDISTQTGLHYKNTYSIIQRGTKKIIEEYNNRFLDNQDIL